jgi:hypothetical protein
LWAVILPGRPRPGPVAGWRGPVFLLSADYHILDFSLIIAPSTTNLPYP